MIRRKLVRLLAVGLGLGVAIAACNPGSQSGSEGGSPGTVTILGSITGDGQTRLEQVLAPFTAETGIQVRYEGSDAFATLLSVRADGGNAPDVALFPQPGLMADFARSGALVPLDSFLTADQLTAAYDDNWLELGSVDGQIYGLWARADVKSLVWYNPQAFAAAGYTIPTTWDQLLALSDQIVADGSTPWCLGIESGAATGWVGTDWVEDMLLRTAGPEVYDQWVSHAIPFTDPRVKAAVEQFGNIALNPDYVVGGSVGVISIPFGDSPTPLFTDPPGCYLHRQANFIASFFPSDVVVGENVSVFQLPGIDPQFGDPVLVGGTVFAMFSDRPEVRALMTYLASAQPHQIWVGLENYISPHRQVTADDYTDELTRLQAEILANAEIVRFDGSDLMPGEVGTGTFWTGMVDYVGGTDADTVLANIEASWPQRD